MANQLEHWFRLADEDRDGGVGGAEAVKFFTRSGLPQDVLGQIWEYASGGGAKLNMMQFGAALRLVSLAQVSGGRLPPEQARMVAMGTGPQLPPPRLAGVTDAAPTPSIATYTPQITGLTPQGPLSGGGMTGMGVGVGSYTPQTTGSYPGPQVTGGYIGQPTGATPGQSPGMPRPPYAPQATGPGYVAAGPTGGLAAAGMTGGVGGLPGFPAVFPADMQRYAAAFVATDTDRDGLTKGAECFPVFMKSGLDKALLKRMWDLVAGNAGSLNQEQFMKCMYLMDGCRRGAQLPAALPPGPWPQVTIAAGPTGMGPAAAGMTGSIPLQPSITPLPMQQTGAMTPPAAVAAVAAAGLTGVGMQPRLSSGGGAGPTGVSASAGPLPAENWSLDSQFGHKGAVKAISDAYDQTLPKIPDLPGKVTFDAKPSPAAGPSSVPDLDSTVASMLAPADKARWDSERQEAQEREQQQRQVEAEAAAAKARIEAFQAALSELVMFKSRVDVALLQATDSAARLAAEAEDTELRYNKARLAAQSQAEEGSAARQKLQALLARKQESVNKLELLQQEIAMMQNLNPAELAALEKEVGTLVAQAAAAEAKKATMEMQLDSGKKQKELLAGRISDLELAAAAGEGDLRQAKEELAQLEAKVSSAQGSALSGELSDLGPLLGKAASAYRRLYSSAAAAGLEVPYEANLNNVGALVWLEQLMAGTADWVDDDAAVSGYTVVNALPDLEGVPPALLRAAAIAAAQQPPIKPAAVIGVAAASKEQPAAAAAAGTAGDQPKEAAAAAAAAQPASVEGTAGEAAPAAATADKGAVAAVAATAVAAAVVGTAAAVAGNDESAETSTAEYIAAEPAEPAEPAAVPESAAAAADDDVPAAADGAEGFEDSAFGDAAVASTPAVDGTAAVEQQEVAFADDAFVNTPAATAAEDVDITSQGTAAADVGLAGEAVSSAADVPAVADAAAAEVAPAAAAEFGPRRSLADEDDSDLEHTHPLTTPLSAEHLSAVSTMPAATAPHFGALAGFDPAAYRLDSDARQLGPQYSIDSSTAGSFFGGNSAAGGAAGAGATGASSGFDDEPAFGGDDSSAAEDSPGPARLADNQGGLMGFEDNAF